MKIQRQYNPEEKFKFPFHSLTLRVNNKEMFFNIVYVRSIIIIECKIGRIRKEPFKCKSFSEIRTYIMRAILDGI